jgi:excisionase family DNA binding protein
MNKNKTSYDELPIMLNANAVAQTLGISRAGAYELMHSKGFPTLRVGKRMMVSKQHFIKWIEVKSGEQHE